MERTICTNAQHLYLAWRSCRRLHTWRRTHYSSTHCRATRHPGWWKAHLPTSDRSGNSGSSARDSAGLRRRAPGSRTRGNTTQIRKIQKANKEKTARLYISRGFLVTTGAEWVKWTHVRSGRQSMWSLCLHVLVCTLLFKNGLPSMLHWVFKGHRAKNMLALFIVYCPWRRW